MLPDLISLKTEFQETLDEQLRARANKKMGIFGQIPRVFVHEGNRLVNIRGDGSVHESEFKEASAEFEIMRSAVPDLTPHKRSEIINGMADEMARKVSQGMFQSLNATLEEAGQTVDNKGKPLSVEVFFQTLEKMDLEFDKNGDVTGLSLVIHPEMAPKLELLDQEFQRDPELQRRHRDLLNRKRTAWRARETARKLVG
jgi:hypothetical protein